MAPEPRGAKPPRSLRDHALDVVAVRGRDRFPGFVFLRVVATPNERVTDRPLGIENLLRAFLSGATEEDVIVGVVVPVVGVITKPVTSRCNGEDDTPGGAMHGAVADQVECGAGSSSIERVQDGACVPGAIRAVVVRQLHSLDARSSGRQRRQGRELPRDRMPCHVRGDGAVISTHSPPAECGHRLIRLLLVWVLASPYLSGGSITQTLLNHMRQLMSYEASTPLCFRCILPLT